MTISILVVLVYLTFILDFLVWPIPSEVSTRAILASDDQGPHTHKWLILGQAIVLIAWFLPICHAGFDLVSGTEVTSPGMAYAGLVLALCGRLFTILASISLRSYRSTANHGDAVNDRSVFAISRHPIVIGLHVTLAGLLLTVQSELLILPYIVTLIYFHKKICQEEAMLNKRFPSGYRLYSEQTPRYLFWL